jgi:hypothetical protein
VDTAATQALGYAEELRDLYEREQVQRSAAERAYAKLPESCRTTVRALASALERRDDIEREMVQNDPVLRERIHARIPFLRGVARDVVASDHEHWHGRAFLTLDLADAHG